MPQSATITTEQIKTLRKETNAGIMECKNALVEAKGDFKKAKAILREKGLRQAQKKSGRTAAEGLIESYIHAGSKIGVLLELNCETDFVSKTDEFKTLVKELAMQIAAAKPEYISREDIPEETISIQKDLYTEQAKKEGKPDKVIDKIIEGKINKFYQQICLLEQPYIRDEEKRVTDLIQEIVAKLGENIVVKRFSRFQVGE